MTSLINDIQFELRLSSSKLKAFFQICHLIAKIGKDLIIEIDNESPNLEPIVSFRALSDAKTALCKITFEANDEQSQKKSLFDYVRSFVPSFSCKIGIKAVLSIMKNIRNLLSIVIRGQIVDSQHELVFEMASINSVTKSYCLNYCDTDVMNAFFKESSSTSLIQCQPKVLNRLIEHIHHAYEMAITAEPNVLHIRSFHSGNVDSKGLGSGYMQSTHTGSAVGDTITKRSMTTGISVNTNEFDVYTYRGGRRQQTTSTAIRSMADITSHDLIFCIREFKALLSFSESMDLSSVEFYFSLAGRPVKVACAGQDYTVTLIMSTLHPQATATNVQVEEDTMNDDNSTERPARGQSDERPPIGLVPRHRIDIASSSSSLVKGRASPISFNSSSSHEQNDSVLDFDNVMFDDGRALVNDEGEPLPLSLQEAVVDLSHLAGAVISSPIRRSRVEEPKSSGRKRRIVESQDE